MTGDASQESSFSHDITGESSGLNPIRIERLSRAHVRHEFTCGEPTLDNYLQRIAVQHDERRVSRTFVAVETGGDSRVMGYYTLAAGRIDFDTVPTDKKLPPRVPVPVILLGRLAMDLSQKGRGLGKMLLLHALWRAVRVAEHAVAYAVGVDALYDEAARFYLRFGFVPLLDDPLHLYMPMRTITALGLDFDAL